MLFRRLAQLALAAIGPEAKDAVPVLIESLLSAQFDVGHYKQIKLTSPTGEVMVDRVSDAVTDQVPVWFVNLIPLQTEPGIAQVQDGWRQYGTLSVISHNRFAYQFFRGIVLADSGNDRSFLTDIHFQLEKFVGLWHRFRRKNFPDT